MLLRLHFALPSKQPFVVLIFIKRYSVWIEIFFVKSASDFIQTHAVNPLKQSFRILCFSGGPKLFYQIGLHLLSLLSQGF